MLEFQPPLPAALLEFIGEGAFYGVGIGQQLPDVRRRLGQEERCRTFEWVLSLRWERFPAELHFDAETGVLWWLELDLEMTTLPALFHGLSDFGPGAVGQYLTAHGVLYTEHSTPDYGEDAVQFLLPHAIEFSFWDDPDAGLPAELAAVSQGNTLLPHLVLTPR